MGVERIITPKFTKGYTVFQVRSCKDILSNLGDTEICSEHVYLFSSWMYMQTIPPVLENLGNMNIQIVAKDKESEGESDTGT